MTFKDYMAYTCQQMYFSRIFNELYDLFNKQVDWKLIIDKLSNKKIQDTDTLISFNQLFETNNIQEIDKQIKFLIELRGRYIIHLLNNTKI